MKFNLLDRIESLADDRIVAIKQVSLAEEYLADHFPTFPVLPGVMMLEALVQAAGWLLHRRHNFARSLAVLREVRNVRYGRFVAPGNVLRVDVHATKWTETGGTFRATGTVGDAQAVTAKLEMSYLNLADRDGQLTGIDLKLREHNRLRWALLEPSAKSMPRTTNH
mgnify:CR=1 FL=1